MIWFGDFWIVTLTHPSRTPRAPGIDRSRATSSGHWVFIWFTTSALHCPALAVRGLRRSTASQKSFQGPSSDALLAFDAMARFRSAQRSGMDGSIEMPSNAPREARRRSRPSRTTGVSRKLPRKPPPWKPPPRKLPPRAAPPPRPMSTSRTAPSGRPARFPKTSPPANPLFIASPAGLFALFEEPSGLLLQFLNTAPELRGLRRRKLREALYL